MDRRKFVSRWILATGIIISLTGLLHVGATPMMYRQMLQDETVKDKAPGFAYFFAFCGFAVLYAGLLSIYSSFGLKKSKGWARLIAISSGVFVALGGICAVVFAKFGNPLIYVMSVSAVSNLFLLLFFY